MLHDDFYRPFNTALTAVACLWRIPIKCLLLIMPVALVGIGCTGSPRPDMTLPHVSEPEAWRSSIEAPAVSADYELGPNDLLLITYLKVAAPTIQKYRIEPGDVILAEFHGNEHLNRNLIVGSDGYVIAPFVGEVMAAGREVMALADDLRKRFIKGEYLKEQTSLTLSLVRSNSSYEEFQKLNLDETLGGNAYGRMIVVGMDGLLQLPLVGPLKAAGKTVSRLRNDIQAEYSKIFPASSVLLELRESRSNLVYVLGEVNRPGVFNMTQPTTVAQALVNSLGYKDSADLSSVVLVRRNKKGAPEATLVNLEKVIAKGDLSEDILLSRYDVIYVPPSRIYKMNQAILFGIRNMMPVQASINGGFSYVYTIN
ncbi:MAG: hypothetical protein CSA22_09500 [Deltaproteobacteria bacterium]|nr:MAG: hypothetical protein CSA22_09500 [Deltaproteobacteria bacterium]